MRPASDPPLSVPAAWSCQLMSDASTTMTSSAAFFT
jgi:hypothetical protein